MMDGEVRVGQDWKTLFRRLVTRFFADRCMVTAAELSFVTALAFVPALAVIIPILAMFPAFQDVTQRLLDFAFQAFVPEASHLLTAEATKIAKKATQLSPMGVVFLVITVLLTMERVEETLNQIWGVKRPRRLTSRLPVYWTVLTVGPLLLATGLLTSSYVASLPFLRTTIGYQGLEAWWMRVLPIVTSAAVFFLLYWLVPHRRVPWKAAAIAAIVAALLFQAALAGFTLYFRVMPTYQALYGAVAAIPVFLVWVYISWNVTLLAAELSFCLAVPPRDRELREATGIDFLHAVTLLRLLLRAQRTGRPLEVELLDAHADELPQDRRAPVLTWLEQDGLATRTSEGDYVATRNLDEVTLADVWNVVGGPLPDPNGAWVEIVPGGPELADALARARERAATPLSELRLSALEGETG
jgi:membrane protein